MVAHAHLACNPQTQEDHSAWQEWVEGATSSELLDAFLARLHPGRVNSNPDLEPVQRLLVDKLRAHLQGGQV